MQTDRSRFLAEIVGFSAATRLRLHTPSDVWSAYTSLSSIFENNPFHGIALPDYSLRSSGPMYSILFHGRRLHDAICHIYTALRHWQTDRPRAVIDYGTGTGAVVWAMAILYLSGCLPKPKRPLQIVAYDTSAAMLDEAKALWHDFACRASRVREMVDVQWTCDPSADVRIDITDDPLVIFASYPLPSAAQIEFDCQILFRYVSERAWNHFALWSSPMKMGHDQLRRHAERALGHGGCNVNLHRDIDSPFWRDKMACKRCRRCFEEVVRCWKNDSFRAYVLGAIDRRMGDFSWKCTLPSHPMTCWTNKRR
ncbi:MAG: hypothetical protein KF768_03890 [Phycisphaeraceae bacterium]|nr:hypothetical protein [Phycisphaeraceae bacterium]